MQLRRLGRGFLSAPGGGVVRLGAGGFRRHRRPAGGVPGTDDPDAAFDRAPAAGATGAREMVDQDYGGRGGSVRVPEGNHGSFGNHQPR